jgi:hypothetical protein
VNVVFRDKVQVVDQPHRLLQTWMKNGSRGERGVCCFYALQQRGPRPSEPG